MFLFGLTVALVLAVYIYAKQPEMQTPTANNMEDFSFPTNSNGRVIPEIFGTQETRGNVIYFGDLKSVKIWS